MKKHEGIRDLEASEKVIRVLLIVLSGALFAVGVTVLVVGAVVFWEGTRILVGDASEVKKIGMGLMALGCPLAVASLFGCFAIVCKNTWATWIYGCLLVLVIVEQVAIGSLWMHRRKLISETLTSHVQSQWKSYRRGHSHTSTNR